MGQGVSSGHSAPIWLPDDVPERAADGGPGTWVPATHVGDQNGIPDSWLLPGPVPDVAGIWEVNQ